MTNTNPYPPEWRDAYDRDGLAVIPLGSEIQALRRQFRDEAAAWLAHWGGAPCRPETLAGDLVEAARRDRPLVGKLYKVSRRFPSIKQIACHPDWVDLAAHFMRTPLVSCCHFVSVRIDLPAEDRFVIDTHQDFPYIQGSLNGLTVWLPVTDVSLEMGPPSFLPGSHRWGPLKVKEYTLEDAGQVGAKVFELAEPNPVRDEEFVRRPVAETEALWFHTLLVHRGEPNRSDRARISIQIRFDDLLNRESFDRNYPEGRYLDVRLASTYPEWVV